MVASTLGPRVPEQFPELVERFRRLATPNIADCMSRLYTMDYAIGPVGGGQVRMAGTALTVSVAHGDNLMVHKAIDMAQPGDVIVVSAGGDVSRAIVGELMCRCAQWRGVAGMVVDGAVRDGEGIREMGFPVFAGGLTPAGPYKNGPGEINVPVACGGVVVFPGDIVVGDGDGVVVIPAPDAESVLAKAEGRRAREEKALVDVGVYAQNRGWVDKALRELGCEVNEGEFRR
ncbi:MAG: RraA family protein [Firmicutes bacterium]|nr:RraA family protein [Bacillota bacterium]